MSKDNQKCYICGHEFKTKEWKFSFNRGLCCGNCSEIGKLNQEMDTWRQDLESRTENLNHIFNPIIDLSQ